MRETVIPDHRLVELSGWATVTYYKGGPRLMPAQVYPSSSFEERFGWQKVGAPESDLRETLRAAAVTGEGQQLICADAKSRQVA